MGHRLPARGKTRPPLPTPMPAIGNSTRSTFFGLLGTVPRGRDIWRSMSSHAAKNETRRLRKERRTAQPLFFMVVALCLAAANAFGLTAQLAAAFPPLTWHWAAAMLLVAVLAYATTDPTRRWFWSSIFIAPLALWVSLAATTAPVAWGKDAVTGQCPPRSNCLRRRAPQGRPGSLCVFDWYVADVF